MKAYVKPKGFEDFTVEIADFAGKPDVLRIYDMDNKIIWINATAAPDANIVRMEPKR